MIRVLPKQVSDKIAAGEVVERPVSMLKELVENAIDAGATQIVVEIKNGGKSYLRVSDNGSGIPSDQVELAFHRHATSKIEEAEDLDHISTLGFRGEALSSIAAVTRTEIITKVSSEKTGTRLNIEGGDVVSHTATGCPDGTTIIIRDLFYNTPARLKFLKPDGTESGLIIDFLSQMALAYPHIRFRMINNEQSLFSTLGNGDRLQGIHTLFGRVSGNKLLPIRSEQHAYKMEGYVSDPGEHRSNRKGQVFFVNGRVVSNKTMERALDRAYVERLFDGRHPVAYLFLEVPPEELDVNIHPNKREIRFHRESEVEEFVRMAIHTTLRQREAIPELTKSPTSNPNPRPFIRETLPENTELPQKHQQIDIKLLLSDLRNRNDGVAEESIADTVIKQPAPAAQTHQDGRFRPETLSVTGVAFGTYILATDEDTLYLIDQHAAHERILYENMLKQMEQGEKAKQTILVPLMVKGGVLESDTADEWMEALSGMGFHITPFGPDTYMVKEIPNFMTYGEAERFLSDFMDHIHSDSPFFDRKAMMKAATSACKEAVKGKEHLSPEEIDELLLRLSQCENPMSCPHGRPTFIRFSQSEIERKFRRI